MKKGNSEELERQVSLILELLKQDHEEYSSEYNKLNARIEEIEGQNRSLKDELNCCKNEIQGMNNYIYQLHMEKVELKTEFEISNKHAEEKLVELQNQVERQMLVISELGEEKKKIVRQFLVGYLVLVYVVATFTAVT